MLHLPCSHESSRGRWMQFHLYIVRQNKRKNGAIRLHELNFSTRSSYLADNYWHCLSCCDAEITRCWCCQPCDEATLQCSGDRQRVPWYLNATYHRPVCNQRSPALDTDGETDDEVTSHDVHKTPTVDDKVRRDKADHTVFICLHRSGAGHIVFYQYQLIQ